MSISTSFAHGGKPSILPPISQFGASAHGSAVSEVATNLDPQDQNGQDANNDSQDETGNQTDNQGSNGQKPDTSRVSADNIRSGIQMPALIPNVALEHSSALQVSVEGAFPTPPGQAGGQSNNENAQGSTNNNASFGQSNAASVRNNNRKQ